MIARHRRAIALLMALAAVGLVVVTLYFQPQKLFLNERREEALPTSVASTTASATGQPAADRELARGELRGLEHKSSGQVRLIALADGKRVLRFERLETSNGPDLHVYLSATAASSSWYGYDRDYVDLGSLKGNLGNQNYPVPNAVDVSRYPSAVIWCKRFSVGFAIASLEA